MVPAEGAAASWQYTPPASTASWAAMPAMPAPANRNAPTGMCFNFINKGVCQRGSDCRFQHLGPDHPEVLENKAKFDAECAQKISQKKLLAGAAASWQHAPPAPTASWPAMPAPVQAPLPSTARMCFNFINKGMCQRGSDCRFQHLGPDHPDVLENKAKFDAECAQRMAQKAIDMDDQALWIKTIGGPPV
jgi:hypothetical protein